MSGRLCTKSDGGRGPAPNPLRYTTPDGFITLPQPLSPPPRKNNFPHRRSALRPQSLIAQSLPGGRVVLVLPFENRSGNATLNWIGNSFPDTLDRRLNSAGFLTISHDDRVFALTHLGLPGDFRPSRATTIRIAQQLDANYVVIGSFTLANGQIAIQSQVLSIDKLTLSPPVTGSAELDRLYDAENSIAWKVARTIDPTFNVAEQTFLGAGEAAVPLPAFEDYIRGINAPTSAEALVAPQDRRRRRAQLRRGPARPRQAAVPRPRLRLCRNHVSQGPTLRPAGPRGQLLPRPRPLQRRQLRGRLHRLRVPRLPPSAA